MGTRNLGQKQLEPNRSSRDKEEVARNTENYTEKVLVTDPVNSVVTHLEPHILECEVKWALRSITTNKAGGGDEFQPLILEMLKLLFKVLHLIHQQI